MTSRESLDVTAAVAESEAVNKRSLHSIRHGLDKPGVFTTVSHFIPRECSNTCMKIKLSMPQKALISPTIST